MTTAKHGECGRVGQQSEQLWVAVDAVTAKASHATWACGDSVDTIFVYGVERPVTQMPYPVYSEPMEQLLGFIGELGLVVPFE